MISSDQALQLVLDAAPLFATERVPIDQALGRVLRTAVVAERDLPPFDRVTMDGIAIALAGWQAGHRQYQVQSVQAAGDAPIPLAQTIDHAIQVMTGTPLPPGTNGVIPIEQVDLRDDVAHILDGTEFSDRQFVHHRASDSRAGETLIEAGRTLAMPDLVVTASAGTAEVEVSTCPSIAIVSTGDELVDAGHPILPHQTRMSHHHAMQSWLRHLGCRRVESIHLRDDLAETESTLARALAETDLVLICGGISKGTFDFVPQALQSLGVTALFPAVAQRPGKPFRLGHDPAGTPVFAFPGNPLSTLVCFCHYLLPYLAKASGADPIPQPRARLTEAVPFPAPLKFFAPATFGQDEEGRITATVVRYNTSGSMQTLGQSHGYVELPPEQDCFPAGSMVPLTRWPGCAR